MPTTTITEKASTFDGAMHAFRERLAEADITDLTLERRELTFVGSTGIADVTVSGTQRFLELYAEGVRRLPHDAELGSYGFSLTETYGVPLRAAASGPSELTPKGSSPYF